jgi:hypothetical protein
MQVLKLHMLKRKMMAIALAITLLWTSTAALAQERNELQLEEQKIKAGLIYNFLKYTAWPENKTAKLVVCILGSEDPFNGYLQPLEGRTVNQKPIILRHVSSAEDAEKCQMLFIGATEQAQWPNLQRNLMHTSVLTVGDFNGFTNDGGMIEFGTNDDRVQIDLNNGAVDAAHLHVAENLRRMAKTTHSQSGGGE